MKTPTPSVIHLDDDEEILGPTNSLLELLGYEIFSCYSVQEVNARVSVKIPDAFLFDLALPNDEKDGDDFAKELIERLPELDARRFIFLTAYKDEYKGVFEKPSVLFGAQVLQKRAKTEALVSALERCIQGQA